MASEHHQITIFEEYLLNVNFCIHYGYYGTQWYHLGRQRHCCIHEDMNDVFMNIWIGVRLYSSMTSWFILEKKGDLWAFRGLRWISLESISCSLSWGSVASGRGMLYFLADMVLEAEFWWIQRRLIPFREGRNLRALQRSAVLFGLIVYYWKFIKGFTGIVMLKTRSTCKDVKCGWIDFVRGVSLNWSTTNEDTSFGFYWGWGLLWCVRYWIGFKLRYED